MKKTILTLLCALALPLSAHAADWLTDYDKALEVAKEKNKPVLILFTGSDWCPPCMRMEKTVFSSKEFSDLADKYFVLIKLDSPKNKPQSAEEKKMVAKLGAQYEVQGVPTIVILGKKGKEIDRIVGSRDKESFLKWLTALRNK